MVTLRSPYPLPEEPLPVRLVNTVWAQRGVLRDDLSTPDAALVWLQVNGLPTENVSSVELEAVLELRMALRTSVAYVAGETQVRGTGSAHLGAEGVDAALAVINSCSPAAPTGRLALVEGQVRWVDTPPGPTVAEALSTIAVAATAMLLSPDAARLRACHGPRCVLFFTQDHSRRQWCSAACGNRARAARHYRRHHEDAAS